MGRVSTLFAVDLTHALATLTMALALALSPSAAVVAFRGSRGGWILVAGFSLAFAGPLVPDLALSLMSD
ncbi:MAG: hypothetical protein WAU58_10410, partial [Terriglobales bacterium]